MPTLIVAGLGTAQRTFNPPITETSGTVSGHTHVAFVPPVPSSDVPTRLLVSAEFDGNFDAKCTGTVTNINVNGTLRWSDNTTSAFHLDTSTVAETVQGHSVAYVSGTISNGYYQGARIDSLGLGFAGEVAACLSGQGVSDSTGAVVIIVTAS